MRRGEASKRIARAMKRGDHGGMKNFENSVRPVREQEMRGKARCDALGAWDSEEVRQMGFSQP